MDESVRRSIEDLIHGNKVVLFMKGSRAFPQCGFSARVVQILEQAGSEFKDVNVLADTGIREGIKEYANWPTIPQLFVEGRLVGGCDIVTDLANSGELPSILGLSQQAE